MLINRSLTEQFKNLQKPSRKLLNNSAKITLNIWLCLIFRRSRLWCSYWRRRRYSLGWKRDGSFMADSLTGEFRDLSIWQYSAYNWCWAFQLATRLGHLNSFAWFVFLKFQDPVYLFQTVLLSDPAHFGNSEGVPLKWINTQLNKLQSASFI